MSRKYNLKINNQSFLVEILSEYEGIFKVNVNGTIVEVKDTSISSDVPIKNNYSDQENNSQIQLDTEKENISPNQSNDKRNSGQIKAMMPGKVLEILVEIGDEVSLGTPLMIVESMKMENTISSTMSGNYIQNLFNFINYDLSGLTFNSVDFEWSILATDLSSQVEALNSPVVFTVFDSSPLEYTTIFNSKNQKFPDLQSFIFNQIISEK